MSSKRETIILSDAEIKLATYESYDSIIRNNINPGITNKNIKSEFYQIFGKGSYLNMIIGYVEGSNIFIHGNDQLNNVDDNYIILNNRSKSLLYRYNSEDSSTKLLKYKSNRDLGYKLDTMYKHLSKFVPIKITDSEISSKVFGLKTAKESLVGTIFKDYTIEYGKSEKLNKRTLYITVPYKEINIKFCICDVEFIFPNFKGYNPPKDKTIKVGSIVKIIGDSNNIKYSVIDVIPDRFSRRISRSTNRRRDLITISNGLKSSTIYCEKLKLVK